MSLASRIEQARQAGYADADILRRIESVRPDLSGGIRAATRAGYSPSDLVNFLCGSERGDIAGALRGSSHVATVLYALDQLDSVSRAEVEAFARILGASGHVVVLRGAPDPVFPRGVPRDWDAWRRQRDDRIFARAREASGGKSFYERMQETEEGKKRERLRRKEWLDRQRRIAHGWAKWMRWHRQFPQEADDFRRQHQDADGGDRAWLVEFASMRAPRVPGDKKSGLKNRNGGADV